MKIHLLAAAAALVLGCDQEPIATTFHIQPHPDFAVGTSTSLQVVADGTAKALGGRRSLFISSVKATVAPAGVVAITNVNSPTIDIEVLGAGTAELTIEASVENQPAHWITHRITTVPAASVSYRLVDDGPLAAGTLLGRGLGYQVSSVEIKDASGVALQGNIDIVLPGTDSKDRNSWYLFSARAGEVNLRAPLGVTGPKVRFADVNFLVNWSTGPDGDMMGSVTGIDANHAPIQITPAIYLTHEEVTSLTPNRCSANANQRSIYVRPVAGGTGPCRISLLLSRETNGHYPDRELIVPLP